MGFRDFQNLLQSYVANIHLKFIYQGQVGTIFLHNGPVDMGPEVSFPWALPGFTFMLSRQLMMFLALIKGLLYRLVFRAAITAW